MLTQRGGHVECSWALLPVHEEAIVHRDSRLSGQVVRRRGRHPLFQARLLSDGLHERVQDVRADDDAGAAVPELVQLAPAP
jgi:hypothetical protein